MGVPLSCAAGVDVRSDGGGGGGGGFFFLPLGRRERRETSTERERERARRVSASEEDDEARSRDVMCGGWARRLVAERVVGGKYESAVVVSEADGVGEMTRGVSGI